MGARSQIRESVLIVNTARRVPPYTKFTAYNTISFKAEVFFRYRYNVHL